MVHSAGMSRSGLYSFEDEVLQDISEGIIRRIPRNYNHSIAWIIWHLARIEDVTMNLLIADNQQVINMGDWLKQMKTRNRHTGNGMYDKEIAGLSAGIDIEALKAYRIAVALSTRKLVRKLKPGDLKHRVEPSRLKRIWDEKAMLKEGKSIVDYWGGRDIAGLLLMPPTRHCFLHLNEARRLKEKRR